MEDVLELYSEPYDSKRPVICFDEKPYQLLSDVLAPMPVKPGQAKCIDYHYKRKGVCNLLCAFEPLTGHRIVRITKQRRRKEYAKFMKELVEQHYPDAEIIRLVQDNLNTHSGGSFYEAFDGEQARSIFSRFEYHFTPKNASWLNKVEIEFSAISKNCLDHRIGSIKELRSIVDIRVKERNKACATINWQFSKNDAREKFKRFYKKRTIKY